MAIKITTVNESLEDSGVKILVHGAAGSGKTTMSVTAGIPTLIISAESGLLSIKDAPDHVKVVEVRSLDDLGEVYNLLKSTDHGFELAVLDSVSEIGEVVLTEEKKTSKDARAAYGNLIEMMTVMLKRFRDLPMNVMMTCKQQRITDDDTGHTLYAPQLPGARLANDLPYLFDEVLALRVELDDEGKAYRVLQTGTDMRYVAKDRSGNLDMFESPNLRKLFAKIHGEAAQESKKAVAVSTPELKENASVVYYYSPSDKCAVKQMSDDFVPHDWIEMSVEDYEEFLVDQENAEMEAAAKE